MARSGSTSSGWLFVDYPSYGACRGKPTPETVRETAQGAVSALPKYLNCTPKQLLPTLGTFSHSIGCAAALDIAATLDMKRSVIVALFTSMQAMAAGYVTPLLTVFLRHRFDNRISLDLLAKSGHAKVIILHDTTDRPIPASMGRSLAERHIGITDYRAIQNAGHNDFIHLGAQQIANALRELESL